jgi:hypothetical protein
MLVLLIPLTFIIHIFLTWQLWSRGFFLLITGRFFVSGHRMPDDATIQRKKVTYLTVGVVIVREVNYLELWN